MKKTALVLMLTLVFLMTVFSAGCAADGADTNVSEDNTVTEQNETVDIEAIDEYLASVKAQSDAINTSLEEDATLTQTDINLKALEQSELWNAAMDYLMDALENHLSEDEFAKLQSDQTEWVVNKDAAVAAAGAEFEGGSFHSFIVCSEDARLTEERVLELYEILK